MLSKTIMATMRPLCHSPQMPQKELQWWIENIENSFSVINHDPPSLKNSTDESKIGWGGVFEDLTCGGHWTPQEAEEHINYLELMAAFFSLQAFVTKQNNKHVRLKIDNTTAVAAIITWVLITLYNVTKWL